MKSRLLSLLLASCLVLSLLPVATVATEATDDPPPITNPAITWFKDQLGATAGKLYDAFEVLSEMDDFKNGTASVDLLEGNYITPAELSAYLGGDSGLAKAFQDARDAFFQDYPEFFYIDTTKLTLRVGSKEDGGNVAYINNGPNENYLDSHYKNKAAVETAILGINSKKSDIVTEIRNKKNEADTLMTGGTKSGALSTAEIVTMVHNKVVELFDYAYPSDAAVQVTGVSSLTTKKANCQGYSKTVKWILDELDIPCVLVNGAGQNSVGNIEEHMWNYVRVDGTWYAVDATWDDPTAKAKALRYTYLLQGSGLMAANHAPSGQFSPGGMTFTYPEISDLSYDLAMSAVLNDLDSDLKVYTQRAITENVESTKYMITYLGEKLNGVMGKNPEFYLAARFAYKQKGVLQPFKPWVDMSAYSLDWNDTYNFLSLAFSKAGSVQFCITDKPMGTDENGKSRLCYAEDLSLEGNHIALSKPLLVPYYSGYIAPPYVRISAPALTQRISPVKTHYKVEYTEALEIVDPTKPIGLTIQNTSDLTGTMDETIVASVENLTISPSRYTTPDGEIHESSILSFDFIPDKTYQGYSVYYSLYPTNLQGIVSKKSPNEIGISTTFDMKVPCPLAGLMPGPHDAFVVAYPKLIASGSSDAFVEQGTTNSVNSMDIRLVATIPDKAEEDAMLGALGDDVIHASSVYDLTLGCKSYLANLRSGSGIFDVTVGLPYPPGFNYNENKDVTFKAYHYKLVDGEYVAKELVCRITELGLQVIVNGFSPFSVVAVPKDDDSTEVSNKFISVSQNTSGGKVTFTEQDPTNAENSITVAAAGLYALKADDTKIFSIVPDEGYQIDKVLLNGEETNAVNSLEDSSANISFTFDSMNDENTLEVFFIANTVKVSETDQKITSVVPKLTPVALGYVDVSLTAGDGTLTLSKPAGDGSYYYKTSLNSELGAKPTVGDRLDESRWTALTESATLTLDSGMEFFVQVIRVGDNGITAWGESSATPRRTMEQLTPTVTTEDGTLTLAGPIIGDAASYYYQYSVKSGKAPALDSTVDTTKWTALTAGENASIEWDGTATYVRLLKAKDEKVIGWGEYFVDGKAPPRPPSSGSDSDSDSGSSSGSGSPTTPPKETPSVSVSNQTASVSTTATVSDGVATVSLKHDDISNAIAQLEKSSVESGKITISVAAPKAESLSATIPAKVQEALLDANVSSFSIESPLMTVTLDHNALAALQETPSQAVTLKLSPVTVTDPAVGSRPAYDIKADVGGKLISDFADGRLTLSIPYTATSDEKQHQLCGVYVDENGQSNWLPLSRYDETNDKIYILTNHLSVYAVGLRPEVTFSDTVNHWANDGIAFATARGIFSGTGDGVFSPNTPITRGMFVTVLGRIVGANVSDLQTAGFRDVPADSYFAPYVAWAKTENIVSGIGDGLFAPNRAITRQEMALIMDNFMKATALVCPTTLKPSDFSDASTIASWAADAVQLMQACGLMNGKEAGRFDPNGTATRSECAVLLQRYIQSVIGQA